MQESIKLGWHKIRLGQSSDGVQPNGQEERSEVRRVAAWSRELVGGLMEGLVSGEDSGLDGGLVGGDDGPPAGVMISESVVRRVTEQDVTVIHAGKYKARLVEESKEGTECRS